MKRQVLVIGLGRFGSSVAATLFDRGHDVLAVDHNERRVQEMVSRSTHAVQAEATSEAALRELGVKNFDVAVVAAGHDVQSSVLATVLLQRIGVPYVVSRAQDEVHGLILEKIGAHAVVYPEKESGERLAHNLAYREVMDYLELSAGFGVSKITPPPAMLGKTLEEAGLVARGTMGLTILAIKRGAQVMLTPDRFERIQPGDILVAAGTDEQLEKVDAALGKP
ncbi:MAG: TrkA family potassium uptake protein [Dehalococcoidia bacterium]|nr:TrkA family potassium uptake protein [Dehalococcoidia bacterium]